MEIIIIMIIVLAVSSLAKSFTTGTSGPNTTNRNTARSDESSWTARGSYDKNTMLRTQEQTDYRKVTARNENLREIEARLSRSLRTVAGEPAQAARTYARTSSARTAQASAPRRNRSVVKSQFDNHTESSAALRDEIQEATLLWHDNLEQMNLTNLEFRKHIEQQHSDQRKWVKESQSLDR